MKARHTLSIFSFLLLVILTGCDGRLVEYQSVTDSQWERSDVKEFTMVVPQRGFYQLSFLLRTDQTYPYMDMAVVVDQLLLPEKRCTTDTLTCHIFDSHGHSQGHGVSISQQSYPISREYLTKGDTLKVTLRHVMKRMVLPGVTDLGLSIERE